MGSDDARAAPAGTAGPDGPAGEDDTHSPSVSWAQLSFRIDARVWPVFLMILSIATLAVVTFAMKSLVEQFDAASRVREEALVENGLKGRQVEIENSIVPQVVWDEAVRNLDNEFSPDWARDNIGVFLSTMAGFSRTFVLDASDSAVFASDGEEVATPAAYEDVAAAAAPLVSAVRAAEAKRQHASKAGKVEGALSDPIQASAPVILGARSGHCADRGGDGGGSRSFRGAWHVGSCRQADRSSPPQRGD